MNKPPLFHEMIADGVPEAKAMKWHSAIMILKSHADNMEWAINTANGTGQLDDAVRSANWYKEYRNLDC